MRDHDTERQDAGPEKIFRALRDRPTPELDEAAAWARLQSRLEDHPQGLVARLRGLLEGDTPWAWRWAPVGLAVSVIAVGWLVLAPVTPIDGPVAEAPAGTPADRDLVLLADADDAPGHSASETPGAPGSADSTFELDARLVRGYAGALPPDALPIESSGAGGADLMADLAPTLSGVVPSPDFALIGRWQGEVRAYAGDQEAGEATLSDRHRLSYRVERTADGLRLLDVRFLGEGTPLIAEQIDLEPGRLYVFGAGGSDSDLVLALRLTAILPEPAARQE